MRLRHTFSQLLLLGFGILFCAGLPSGSVAQQPAGAGKTLTVERIYSQPSLSGQLTRGLAWTPDGKGLSYFETKGSGKEAKTELWVMDAASGERRLLVGADKLEAILLADKGQRKLPVLGGALPPNTSGRRMERAFCFKAPRQLPGWM